MEPIDEKKSDRTVSIPSLIGWLSLCLLTAAWGRTLDDHWQPIWMQLGTFGLVAAFALKRLEAARLNRNRWKHFRELQSRVEERVARFNEQGSAIETINAGIDKLRRYAQTTHDRAQGTARGVRRTQLALLAHLPLVVIPVEEDGDDLDRHSTEAIEGALRHISTQAVAFDHAEPFATQLVLLEFRVGAKERLSFVVDVIWSQHNKSWPGFASGGTVLAVGVPAEHQEPVRETTTEAEAASLTAAV